MFIINKGDKFKYVILSGYTEYHASQIELLIMLGAKNIEDKIEFSVNQTITTIAGEMKIYQYIDMKRSQEIGLFQRNDFPKNIEQLKTAFGLLFNYWGLRSICYMYCEDFDEKTDNTAFTRYIPVEFFDFMNQLMVGWLSDGRIELCYKGYGIMIMSLIKEHNLA